MSINLEQTPAPTTIVELINNSNGWHWDTVFTGYTALQPGAKLWTVKSATQSNASSKTSYITVPKFKYGGLSNIMIRAVNFKFHEYLNNNIQRVESNQTNHSISLLLGTGEAYDKIFEIYSKMVLSSYILYMLYLCNAPVDTVKTFTTDDELYNYLINQSISEDWKPYITGSLNFIQTMFNDTKQFEKLSYTENKDVSAIKPGNQAQPTKIEDVLSFGGIAKRNPPQYASEEHMMFNKSNIISQMETHHSKMFSMQSKSNPNSYRRIISTKLRTGTTQSKCFDICILHQPSGAIRLTDNMWKTICQSTNSYDATLILQIGLPESMLKFSSACKLLGIKITGKQTSNNVNFDGDLTDAIDINSMSNDVSSLIADSEYMYNEHASPVNQTTPGINSNMTPVQISNPALGTFLNNKPFKQ